jgi:hypothetical protein
MPNKILSTVLVALIASSSYAFLKEKAPPKPKYSTSTIRLQDSPDYIRSAPAPDYWMLSPYYVPQLTRGTCSIAASAMVLNALRAQQPLRADQELIHEKGILAKFNAMKVGSDRGIRGVSLDGLERILREAVKKYRIEGVEFEKYRAEGSAGEIRKRAIAMLETNEKTTEDVVVPLFYQADFTGDPEGTVGHFAPIAAYDKNRQRVLILDPDRDWYEPYWVTVDQFVRGISNPKADTKLPGGWIRLVRSR